MTNSIFLTKNPKFQSTNRQMDFCINLGITIPTPKPHHCCNVEHLHIATNRSHPSLKPLLSFLLLVLSVSRTDLLLNDEISFKDLCRMVINIDPI